MPDGRFAALALWSLRHRVGVLIGSVIVAFLAALVALPPRVDANIVTLLPPHEPVVQAVEKLQARGGAAFLLLEFSGDDDALDAAMPDIARRAEALPSIDFALSDVDGDLARQIALLQLDPEAVRALNDRLRGALALGPALNPVLAARLLDLGPLAEKIGAAGNPEEGLKGATRGRMILKPGGSSLDRDFTETVIHEVEGLLADLPEGVTLERMAGPYWNNVRDKRQTEADLGRTTLVSSLLVLLVLVVAFRSWRTPVVLFPPLLVANLVNLAIVQVAIGSLNTFTAFGTAMLMGLGVDFAIHLLGAFREERSRGHDVEFAMARAWHTTGTPCTTAALTSAGGFMALAVADFRGFSQLGIVLASGLMLCLVAILIMLPALIATLDPSPAAVLGARNHPRTRDPRYGHVPALFAVFLLATATVAWTHIPSSDDFEYDLTRLRGGDQAWDQLSDADRAAMEAAYPPIVLTYPDEATVRAEHERLEGLVADGTLPHVRGVVSIASVLPDGQPERVAALTETVRLAEHPNLRYLPRPLAEPLAGLRGFEPRVLAPSDLPRGLSDTFGLDGTEHRILLMVHGNLGDLRESEALMDEVLAVTTEPAGNFLAQGAMSRAVLRDIPRIALVATLLVALFTILDLKRLDAIVGALFALFAGLVWAWAGYSGLGGKLSMINVVGVPILLGIGVDVVIHLAHRLKREGPGGVRRSLLSTGIAVGISVLTTAAAFISLTVADHNGMRSLGILVTVGLLSISVVGSVSIILLWVTGWYGFQQGLPGFSEPPEPTSEWPLPDLPPDDPDDRSALGG